MNIYKVLFPSYFIIQLLCINILAQDNLHLVGTITGTAENNIYYAKGAGDINSDEYGDYIVCFSRDTTIGFRKYTAYKTNLYYGNAAFDTIPDYTFDNSYSYPVGDVNKDGYDDLIIAQTDYSYYPPLTVFKIYKGGEEIDTLPIFSYSPTYLWDMGFSHNIEDIGDLNGDGYNDFVISSPYNWSDGMGKVYLFHGGDTLKEEPVQILSVKLKKNGTSFFGSSVTGIGDINKDGYDDILIAETALDGDSSNVQLFTGGNKIDSIPKRILMPCDSFFGERIKNAGDLNGDGSNEFIIRAYYRYYIYSEFDGIDSPIFTCEDIYPLDVGAGGDINNDGYNDFLISNYEFRNMNDSIIGLVSGYYGSSVIDTILDFKIFGEQTYSSFGFSPFTDALDIVNDINGDGYDDIIIISPAFRLSNKQIGKVYLYSYSKINDVHNYENNVEGYLLTQNYPNPFNPDTKFRYYIPIISNLSVNVYNTFGEHIITLINENKSPGEYYVIFNASNYHLSSGIYFIEMSAWPLNVSGNKYRKVIKTILLK